MSQSAKRRMDSESEPVRVLGRGLRAERGVRLTLRAIRDAVGKTQTDVAEQSGIDQSDVSRLENREDLDECQVATLRRYIAALGGQLELTARFGDKKIVVVGTSPSPPEKRSANKPLQRTGRKSARR